MTSRAPTTQRRDHHKPPSHSASDRVKSAHKPTPSAAT
eukprot:CAMPEP_0180375454 /NCGR_PEP_ID=MMETSP0989-20121125/22698_1 /TAXON_ID=697907 /ORGANISM="non described non described, Strain CCMP2293" /LENGTH=37 /DNA_ID= /DNA_START= /DNA_END= /DNA_ORIENTATION=